MFGGDQNIAGQQINDPLEENAIASEPYEPSFWDKYVLGPATKDERALTEEDKGFLDKKTSESELLASDQLAEEENLIAEGDTTVQDIESDIVGESGTKEHKGGAGQVDEISEKDFRDEVKKKTIEKVEEETKNAEDVKEDDATVIEKANENPGELAKAEGFLKGILGDLFDTKELKRAAIMYVGSRLLGYGHHGSLKHSLKNYVTRVDTKVANKESFIKTNAKNYTPASLELYRKSGNLTDLVPVGSPVNATGTYKTFYGPGGKQIKAEQFKVGKNTVWSADGGKTFLDGTKLQGDPAYVPGTSENKTMVNNFIGKTTDQLKSLRNQFDKFEVDDGFKYKTDINPATSSGKIADWAVKNGVRPEQLSGLVESAYHDAINDQRQDGSRARSLVPYLNQLIIRQKVDNPDAFLAKGYDPEDKGAKQYVNAQKLQTLNMSAAHVMKSKGLKGGTQDLANQFYNAAIRDWNALNTKQQSSYIGKARDDESGFYKFVEENLMKYASK